MSSAITSPSSGSTLAGPTTTFTWSDVGASEYFLSIGSTLGGNDLYGRSEALGLSRVVTGLPTDGSTVFVRIWTRIGDVWTYDGAVYTAATLAIAPVIATPTPGSTLASSATFTWTSAPTVDEFFLYVGTSKGNNNLYNGAEGQGLTRLVTGLPVDGRPLYVRLWSRIGADLQFNDYTYTAGVAQTPDDVFPPYDLLLTPDGAAGADKLASTYSAGTAATTQNKVWHFNTDDSGKEIRASGGVFVLNVVPWLAVAVFGTITAPFSQTLWPAGTWTMSPGTPPLPPPPASKITKPTPSGVLTGSSVTFEWTAAEGAVSFDMVVGTTYDGSDVASFSGIPSTSQAVTGIPKNGRTIYVTLRTHVAVAGGGEIISTERVSYVAAGDTGAPPPPVPPAAPAELGLSGPTEVNVDGTIQLVSVQYETAFMGAGAFQSGGGLMWLDIGQLDPDLHAFAVPVVLGGIVDESEVHLSPNRITSVIRGRDAAAAAVDTAVWVTYAIRTTTNLPTDYAQVPGFPQLPVIEGVTVPAVVNKPWTAATIAKDLCDRIGLKLAWQVPDYVMREDFTVNGPVYAALQQLAEPFNHFEPFKVDIYVSNVQTRGLTLQVVQRPMAASEASASINAFDARITNLVLRRRRGGYIRVLRLITAMPPSASGGGLSVSVLGTHDDETVDEVTDPVKGVISRITTTTHYRDLDSAILSQHITIEKWDDATDPAALRLFSDIQVTNDWPSTPLSVGINGEISVPFIPAQRNSIARETQYESDLTTTDVTTSVFYTYEAGVNGQDGYMRSSTTVKEVLQADGAIDSTSETKTYRRNGLRMYEVTSVNSDGTSRKTSANGTPPGGPGRGRVLVPGLSASSETVPKVYAVQIGTQGKDITISNNNLLEKHLGILAGQARSASGAIETEIAFTAANMPWLDRGGSLSVTGLVDEIGNAINGGGFTGLITEAKHEYRESSPNPTCLTHVRASYWGTGRLTA